MHGLVNDLVGLLNQSRLDALMFQLTDRYEEVLTRSCLSN